MPQQHVSQSGTGVSALVERYRGVRGLTYALCEPLSAEDMVVQVAPEASPAKWHLGHTTWFFETFILERFEPGFEAYDPRFRVLFNSYYTQIGAQHPRPRRGLLTRPGVGEVMAYRDTVDERLERLVERADGAAAAEIAWLIELGINHEQQHQELLLTDIKLLLHASPLEPPYLEDDRRRPAPGRGSPMEWVPVTGGVVEIGHEQRPGVFAYDNEGPRHRRYLDPFEIASRPVSNAEFASFIEDGGYRRSSLWLDQGWSVVEREGWSCPLYWRRESDGSWSEFTLRGRRPLDPEAPAAHLSFFECEAFARWAGARLPTEAEWEHAACPIWGASAAGGNFLSLDRLRPMSARASGSPIAQIAGDVWEWTRSAHEPYPGYAPPEGAIGEYNGKFMCGSFVLRGGSCATPPGHIRLTYRNFFDPAARWQFSGVRLARGGEPGGSAGPSSRGDRVQNPKPVVKQPNRADTFAENVLEGLTRPEGRKAIPPKHLYDAVGSELFDSITRLEAYYPTRTERAILRDSGPEIAAALGDGVVLIEPGSGSGEKAEALLRVLRSPRAFVPVEISESALRESAERVARALPEVAVYPICADFQTGLHLLEGIPRENRVLFFPGSTVGNIDRSARLELLRSLRIAAGAGGWVLVGYDLVKQRGVLLEAYDDPEGVTASFALNVLDRINRVLGAGLDRDAFEYEAEWSESESRVEMYLRAGREQVARVAGRDIRIAEGERIHVEHSHKFTRAKIDAEAHEAGLERVRSWRDSKEWFEVALFTSRGE